MDDQASLFEPSDLEVENALTGWVMPRIHPPASADLTPPAIGSRCSACGCASVWTEAAPERRYGWRCCCCHPLARPPDRLCILDLCDPDLEAR